ncbi:MAG: hypothetical protein GY804_10070 [Alphaproteobacteria bacterium]|nr:hypothetical protein [Alphaproteobacteria bacterium]
MTYSDLNGMYFVFEGENASTGTPNKITGHMSFWGKMISYNSKEAALKHVEEYRGCGICKAGTARTLRKYNLGNSIDIYLEDLLYALSADEL